MDAQSVNEFLTAWKPGIRWTDPGKKKRGTAALFSLRDELS